MPAKRRVTFQAPPALAGRSCWWFCWRYPRVAMPDAPNALNTLKEVKDAAKVAWAESKHLFVVFGAPWCPNCTPFKQELASTIGSEFEIECVEVDLGDEAAEELAKQHEIQRLPTLVIFNAEGAVCKLVAPPMAEVRMAARSLCKPKLSLDADF